MTAGISQTKPVAATRSTIRRKLVGVVLAAVATTTLLGAVASSWREAVRYADAKRAEIRGTAFVFSAAVAEPLSKGDRISVLRALRAIGQIPSFTHARVEDAKGRTVAELGATVALEERADLPIFFRSTLDVHVPIKKEGATIGRLTVLADTSDLKDRLVDGLVTSLLAALFAAGVGIVIALKLQKRITDPLRRLTRSMLDVQQTNDFSRNVDFSSDDETGVLVDAFNGMMTEIRFRDDRLAKHRENLEKTVEERTLDLREAKDVAEHANAAKSDFLATMSHEIRTPMNGMLVMAELLASAELTDRHRRYADIVVKSGQSLLAIINDILDFSKIESGKMDLEQVGLDPAELVDDVLSLFWERAAGKGLDLSAYLAPEVPGRIEGDPVRLNQVLSNLVNNALKFTESGHVSVAVRCLGGEPGSDKVRLEFAVSDTGIGIPREKLDTIFESFSQADQSTTRKFGGTGLGLAICKRLVDAMGGGLEVSSVAGEGSEFRFTIPAADLSEPGETDRPAPTNPLRTAMIALSGDATAGAITSYLEDRGIRAIHIAPGEFVADGARCGDVIFADAEIVGRIPASPSGQSPPKPLVVCVSQMGDTRSDEAIETGTAHDLMMRPISRTALNTLLDRLEAGKPLGCHALERGSAAETPRFTGAKVLVADDSPVNREVVIEALKRLDVRADVVEDGTEAVAHAARQTYDIVFMDCSMPVMDGFEATRQIRDAENAAGAAPVPIVALTAHVAGGAADAWRDAGMNAYLSKPFRLTDLAACLEKFVGQPSAGNVAPAELEPYTAEPDGKPASPPEQAPLEGVEHPALPVIDESVLATVAACSPGDGSELVLRVLGLFETHAPKALLTLAEAAQAEGYGAIADAAHALKSMSRNIGAQRLAEACGALEAEARGGDVAALKAQLLVIRTEVLDVLAEIEVRANRTVQIPTKQPHDASTDGGGSAARPTDGKLRIY